MTDKDTIRSVDFDVHDQNLKFYANTALRNYAVMPKLVHKQRFPLRNSNWEVVL